MPSRGFKFFSRISYSIRVLKSEINRPRWQLLRKNQEVFEKIDKNATGKVTISGAHRAMKNVCRARIGQDREVASLLRNSGYL